MFIFSVGGGSIDPPVSSQLINAANFVKNKNYSFSIVGLNGGEIKKISTVIVVPVVDEKFVTALKVGKLILHF